MAQLKSDAHGFLIGDALDLGHAVDQLMRIKDDVAAIRRAVIPAALSNKSDSIKQTSTASATVATPVGRSAASSPGRAPGAIAEAISATNGHVIRKALSKAVEPKGRDSKGRFTAGDGASGSSASSSLVRGVAGRLVTAVRESAGDSENVDPTIKAAQEVAEPLRRGYSVLFGGEDKQSRWLKKIFTTLNVFKKEETAYSKAAQKSLKTIEEKPESVSAAYSPSLLSKIPILGPVLGGLGAAGKGLMGIGKGLFKKIPILGALLAGLGVASDVYASESDESLSRRDKDKAVGKSFGGLSGTFAGMLAGALAGSAVGPVGTVIGGIVGTFLGDQAGQIIGEKFGEWTSDLREADIPGKIIGAFERWTGGFDFQKGFELWIERTKGNLNQAASAVGEQLDIANSYLEHNTGINAKEMGEAWWERTKGNVSGAWDTVSSIPSWMVDNTTIGKAGKRAVESLRGETGSAERAMQILMDKGWDKHHAAGIAASLQSESGFKTNAVGDGGNAIGVAQWHPDRQKTFEKVFGKKLSDASFEEQVSFVDWELKNTEKPAGDRIRATKTPEQAAASTEQHFERSALGLKGGVQPERLANAAKYSQLAVATPKAPVRPVMPQMPKIADAPEVQIPLNSAAERPITVSLPIPDVGRDLSDRGIAHIATGGIAGRSW